MTRKILLPGMFILAAFLWGCSENQDGVSSMQTAPTGSGDNGQVTNVDPQLQALINDARNTEDGAFDFNPAAAKYSNEGRTYITGPTTITEPGLYVVSDNFSATGDAIVIQSDWVFLFLGRQMITGPGNKSGRGVVIDGASDELVRSRHPRRHDHGR